MAVGWIHSFGVFWRVVVVVTVGGWDNHCVWFSSVLCNILVCRREEVVLLSTLSTTSL
jgi:hypothetical protein